MGVGSLVLAAGLSLAFLAIQVSNLKTLGKLQNEYEITAVFSNVGGLKPRAKVSVAGVTVGRVIGIALNRDYQALVTLKLDGRYALPKDTRASILTAGLLGDNFIGLEPGFDEASLGPGDRIELGMTYPAVLLEQLLSKLVASQGQTPPAASHEVKKSAP